MEFSKREFYSLFIVNDISTDYYKCYPAVYYTGCPKSTGTPLEHSETYCVMFTVRVSFRG